MSQDPNFELVLREEIGGLGETGAGMTYYPTLLIGLGGTGAEVLLRVREMLLRRHPNRDTLHRFLFIDTDRKTFAGKPGFSPISERERCFIGCEQVRTLLEHRDLHPHVWNRFPNERLRERYISNLSAGIGAGQIRSLGALAFVLDYRQVREAITAAYNDLVTIENRMRQQLNQQGAAIGHEVAIYLVASLNGGTGAGCFLDTALVAKDVCQQRNPKLIGIFALPSSCFDEAVTNDPYQKSRLRANAYAALKELQFVLDADSPQRQGPITFQYGRADRLELGPGEKLFDLVYLVDDENMMGRLSSIEHLYELMARSIYQDVASRFGGNAASYHSNDQVLAMVQLCPKTGLPRLFGTVSTSALVYPAERVARYCTFRLLELLLADGLLRGTPPLKDLESAVTRFLQQHQLDDRGQSNQILDSLLLDENRAAPLSVSVLGLTGTWGNNFSNQEFARQIEYALQQFRTAEMPRVRQLVDANFAKLIGRDKVPPEPMLENLVATFARTYAEENGLIAAKGALEQLRGEVEAMKSELERELDRWVTKDREWFLSEFSTAQDALSNIKFGFITRKDERLKDQLIRLHNDIVQNELWALAKPRASELLEILNGIIREEIARWDTLITDLARVREQAKRLWRQLETHQGNPQGRFAVEQEITPPGYERTYYETKYGTIDPHSLLSEVARDFGGIGNLYQWLVALPPADRRSQLGSKLATSLYQQVAQPLMTTDIVDFIIANPQLVEKDLETRLSLTFEACQPFWSARQIAADAPFTEFLGLSVAHRRSENGGLEPPQLVRAWIENHRPNQNSGRFELLHSDTPYEITLGRRTYGARAFYLVKARGWREIYVNESRTAENNFMLESHVAFANIPDLFPEDTKTLELFAIAMALGFIVQRGNWYYFALERSPDGTRVLYSSQAPTVFSLLGEAPQQIIGELQFECTNTTRIPRTRQLAQGREQAMEALRQHPEWIALIEEAFDTYHRAVGNDTLQRQLHTYVARVLEPEIQADDDLFSKEKHAIFSLLQAIRR